MRINRRQFLGSIGASAGAAAVSGCAETPPQVEFAHGVASGDPLQDRAILWTRITSISSETAGGADLTYEVAEDPSFERMASSGIVHAGADKDFTAKVDAAGLVPGRRYFYRFRHGEVISPVGRTRTLPEGPVGSERIAVLSCSSFPHGFFNVYREVAGRLDIDLILHLGDYIYEYSADDYFSEEAKAKGRAVVPANEITALEHYRQRHALYKTDPDLQAAHAAHPFIAVWDDHEIADDSWRTGAENHNDGEGDWEKRRSAAIQAYMEWMPIRENGAAREHIYRSFQIGDLASLIMLDCRHAARDRRLFYGSDMVFQSVLFDFTDPDNPIAVKGEVSASEREVGDFRLIPIPFDVSGDRPKPILDYETIRGIDPAHPPEGVAFLPDGPRFKEEKVFAPGRTILGDEQAAWLKAELAASSESGRPWQIIGQQSLVGERFLPDISERVDPAYDNPLSDGEMNLINMLHPFKLPLALDEWAGYGEARGKFLKELGVSAENAVVLAGDSHNAWAFELRDQDEGKPVAVEFGTPSITSPGLEKKFPVAPHDIGVALKEKNPDLKYVQLDRRGYLILEITLESVTATWNLINTVLDQSYTVHVAKTMRVNAGAPELEDLG